MDGDSYMKIRKRPKFYRTKSYLACILIMVIVFASNFDLIVCCFMKNVANNDILIDVPLVIFEKTYVNVPIKAVLEVCETDFDDDSWSVDVYEEWLSYYDFPHKTNSIKTIGLVNKTSTENTQSNDLEQLYKLTQREAGNQGLDGKRRVVDVVLNRIDDKRFPSNITSVIDQPGQFGGGIKELNERNITICSETINAVNLEISVPKEERLDPESLYFNTSPVTQKGLYQFKDHYFSK